MSVGRSSCHMLIYKHFKIHLGRYGFGVVFYTWIKDRPKFGLGFGAKDNDVYCLGKFCFPPNIDVWHLAKIQFQSNL